MSEQTNDSGEHSLRLLVDSGALLDVRQVTAHEQLNRPFAVDIRAVSTEGGGGEQGCRIDLEAIVGKPAVCRVTMASGLHRVWSGVVAEVRQLRWDATPGTESTYALRLVPNLWLLSQRRGHRVFQHLKIPHIVGALFEEWKLEAEWLVDEARYKEKEYCLQYDETDLSFVHRLLEEAGITYYFINDEAGGGQITTRLVLSDRPHAQERTVEAPWTNNPNEAGGTEFFQHAQLGHRVKPGLYSIGDYNFRKPRAPLWARSEAAADAEGTREIYEHGPGSMRVETGGPGQGPGDEVVADDKSTTAHDVDGEGRERAQRFLDAERSDKRSVVFETSIQSLRPGGVFAMTGHPHDEVDDKDLLCTYTKCTVDAVGRWSVSGRAVFTDVTYRPPRLTPKPSMLGVQAAIVVGPKGEEIYSDEFGRVRVRFLWDRLAEFDDTATCWLRVSSKWAGAQYGQVALPRVGHEVIVDFLDGDPDQPLVVGRVYTYTAPPPYVLPDHKTKSTWQTSTTPDQPNQPCFNELMFDDEAGKELVYVQAERNYMTLTKRNETERTGEVRTMVVGHHRLGVVGGVDSVLVGEQHLMKIAKPKDLKILELGDPEYEETKTFIEVARDEKTKKEKIQLTTGEAHILIEGPNITIHTKSGARFSADGQLILKGKKIYLNCKPADSVSPDEKKKIEDGIEPLEGDVLNAIIQLFSEDEAPEGESALRAMSIEGVLDPESPLIRQLGGVRRDKELSAAAGMYVLVPRDPGKVKAALARTRQAIADRIGEIDVGDPDDALTWQNSARSAAELHADAKATEPLLRKILDGAAAEAGGEANYGPGGKFAVKGMDSLARKIDGGKRVDVVSDAVRGSILVDSPEQVTGAVAALQSRVEAAGGKLIVDNKFGKSNPAGYGAVHVDMFLPTPDGGMIRSEGQMHMKTLHDGTMGSVKEKSHKIYEVTRDPKVGLGDDAKARAMDASRLLWLGGMSGV